MEQLSAKKLKAMEKVKRANAELAKVVRDSALRRTIGKTTYVANLHFKEQGQTFAQKLKRVLKAEFSA